MNTYKIKVYKIYWNDCDDLYVGSTKDSLSNRIAQHRKECKSGKRKTKIYESMRKNNMNELRYCMIESYEVHDKDEQLKWEQYHASELQPNLNMYRCHNTHEDYKKYKTNWAREHKDDLKAYRDSHKEEIRNLNKKYRENNKESLKIKQKIYQEKNKDRIREYKKEWKRKDRLKKKLERETNTSSSSDSE